MAKNGKREGSVRSKPRDGTRERGMINKNN